MECVRVPFPHILINIYGIYSWWLPFWLKRGNLLSNFVLPLSWLLDILNILFMYTWIFVFHLLGSVCSVLIDWLSVLMMPSILSSVYTLVVNALSEQYFTKGVSYSEGSLLLLFILQKKKLSIPVRMFMAFVFKDQMTLQTLVAYSLYHPSILVSVSVLMLASPCCPDSWSVLSFETWYERVSTWLFFLTFSLFVVRLPCRKNIIAVFQGLHKFGEGLWGYKFPQY